MASFNHSDEAFWKKIVSKYWRFPPSWFFIKIVVDLGVEKELKHGILVQKTNSCNDTIFDHLDESFSNGLAKQLLLGAIEFRVQGALPWKDGKYLRRTSCL